MVNHDVCETSNHTCPLSPEPCQRYNLVVWECWKLIDKSHVEEILGQQKKEILLTTRLGDLGFGMHMILLFQASGPG